MSPWPAQLTWSRQWGRGPDGDDVEQIAQRAVTVLARELSEILDPIVDQLETDIPATS